MRLEHCPSEESLASLSLGKLPEAEAEAIFEHVEQCLSCQETIHGADRAADTLIATLRSPSGSESFSIEPECARAVEEAAALALAWPTPTVEHSKENAEISTGADQAHAAEEVANLGQYQLFEKLGQGGMGCVYRAFHGSLQREVALKVLDRNLTANPRAVARFYREMTAIGKLDHPNIVRATDAGEANGAHFLVMELVVGSDLARLVARLGPLSVADACEAVRQAAIGLEHAHAHGMVHRDLKPSNIMVNQAGQIKVLDLGLARLDDEGPARDDLTVNGSLMGTADFMAPEQGEDPHGVDIRADLYSLGCTLFFLLTGRAPFSGPVYRNPMQKLLAHSKTPAPLLTTFRADVPPALSAVVDRALSKSPDDRFATPADFAAALEPFTEGTDLARLAVALNSEVTEPITILETTAALETLTGPGDSKNAHPLAQGDDATLTGAGQSAERSRRRRHLVVGLAAAVSVILAAAFVIRIKDKDGNVVAEVAVQVPKDGAVELEQELAASSKELPLGAAAIKPPALNTGTKSGQWTPPPLDLTPPAPLGSWKMGPEPPWFQSEGFDNRYSLKKSKTLPGLIERPARLAGIKRWNVDTARSRGSVSVVRWSPDGNWLATGATDGHVRLYDAHTMEFARLLPGVMGQVGVVDITWSPDSDELAVILDSATAFRIWSRNGSVLFEELGGAHAHASAAWSADGKLIASGSQHALRLRNAEGAVSKTLIEGPNAGCWWGCIAWSPDNQRLACWHADGKVRIWNPDTGTAEILAEVPPNRTHCIAWSARDWIALTDGQNLRLYDAERKLVQTVPYHGIAVGWHPDGRRVFIYDNSSVRVWDCTHQKEVGASSQANVAIGPHPTALACSPNGQRLVTAGGLLRIHTTDLTKVLFETPATYAYVTDLAWSADGQQLASASSPFLERGVRLWSQTGKADRYLPQQGPGWSVHGIEWSPDNQMLAGVHHEGGVWLSQLPEPLREVLLVRSAAVAWSGDGQHFAVGTMTGQVVILDRTGSPVAELTAGTGRVNIAWSRATNLLAVHCGRQLQFCDPAAGWTLKPVAETQAPHVSLNLVWSSDGEHLSIPEDGWYNRGGKRVAGASRPHAVDWRADGKQYLAIPPLTKRLSAGTRVARRYSNGNIEQHGAMRWHPRGHLIVTGAEQSAITAWDAENLQPYWHAVLLPDQKSVTFSAAGELLDGDAETVEKYLLYYVEREDGRIETLKPSEFQKLLPAAH